MSSRPWESAGRPEEASVARLLADQHPALAGEPVAYFAEGWDFTVFSVGARWLVRLPKRAQTVEWMAREAAVLARLQDRVPAPIPRARLRGEPTEVFPFPFVVYDRLPGVPLDTLEVGAVGDAAARRLGHVVGRTLGVVHALPLDILPPATSPRDDEDGWVRRALDVLGENESLLLPSIAAAARRVLEQHPIAAPRTVLTHGDLGPEHLLVDTSSHTLTGIIDWTDAGPWDAAGDFVGLWVELGEQALEAALHAYDSAGDPQLANRVRLHGTRWLLKQVKTADDGWRPETRPRWLRLLTRRYGAP